MEFELRQATDDDFDLLYQIKNDSIRPYVEQIWGWDEQVQKDFLKRETPIEQVKLILVDGAMAGLVQLTENEQGIFIGSLFLTSPFQSRGIGSAILEQAFQSGKNVRLEVLKINPRAIQFYQNAGMEIEGEDELKYKMIKRKQMTILDKIIERKKEIVAAQKEKKSETELRNYPLFARKTYSLVASLADPNRSDIITEFKRQSPSKGVINGDADVVEVTKGYVRNGSACLSVLTDTDFFGGKNEDLIAARVNEIPILRKDFIVDTYQILEAKAIGADVILLIAACLTPQEVATFTDYAHDLGLEVLLELYSGEELGHIYEKVDLVGINNRNLKTFEVDIDNSIRLLSHLPKDKPAIAESGISHPDTVKTLMNAGFKGFLMGEHFMKTNDPAQAFADYYQALKMLTDEN